MRRRACAPPLLPLVQSAYVAGLLPAHLRFAHAARHCERAQAAQLRSLVNACGESAYGRSVNLSSVRTVSEFQSRVPVVDYDALEPWVERVVRGQSRVLSTEPVRVLERSGGSTSTNKLIPYTERLLQEFGRATGPWLWNMHRQYPGLIGTRSYWSISPATRGRETSPGGTPIGFEDDTEYFGTVARWALRQLMAVPSEVARVPNMEAWRWETCLHLLRAENLGMLSVWSPTFLTLLMGFIEDHLDDLLAQLPPGRRDTISRALSRSGRLTGGALWERLQLVSCWTEGAAKSVLPAMCHYFPGTPVQGKGLLATEGVVSIPMAGPGSDSGSDSPVAAVSSHFLEFVDVSDEAARPLLAHELKVGGVYSPLLSTGAGFLRYQLKDVVTCVGHYGAAPRLRFDGRLDQTSDLVGEKVNVRQVDAAIGKVREQLGVEFAFALLSPVRQERPYYCLFAESSAEDGALKDAARLVEAHLSTGHHYQYARALGQLGPLSVSRVHRGWAQFEKTLIQAGRRAGDIKPTHLETQQDWRAVFGSSGELSCDA